MLQKKVDEWDSRTIGGAEIFETRFKELQHTNLIRCRSSVNQSEGTLSRGHKMTCLLN